jgi:hypothetical protein
MKRSSTTRSIHSTYSMRSLFLPVCGLIAAVLLAGAGRAADDDRQRGNRRGPPQVAIDACASASESAACSFEGRRGEALDGTCEAMHDSLVCVPEGHRRGGERQQGKPCDHGDDGDIEPRDEI